MSLPARFLLLFASSSIAAAQVPAPDPEPTPPEPYQLVDRVGGSWVNLATFPVRPMVFDPEGNLWVVNHADSTVERFVGATTTPDKVYGVPWSPVAIAWWEGDGVLGPELLVVCRGTWAVYGLDPASGAPTRLLQLRPGPAVQGLDARIGRMAEPGDILVDEVNDRAFVSCTGADSVVQIDLAANQVVRVFNEEADPIQPPSPPNPRLGFRMKSPLFLSFDHNGTDVLCAPLHSGNNSIGEENLFQSDLVEDYDNAPIELPDEDLFRIHPLDASSNGSVELVLREVGTILFAHGLHPLTGDFWQLDTQALNKDPNRQNEPALKGDFVENRVSIVDNAGTTWGSAVTSVMGLDPGDQGGLITTTNTVGQPYALAFEPGGYAYVAGALTDNVVILDSNGRYVHEWNLPPGSIPHGILVSPTNPRAVAVYLWGSNRVRVFTVDPTVPSATPRVTYRLRHDPTPANVAAGRRSFFDASHSAQQNLSCASCHVEGGNDFLVWNLSNAPLEEKGPMFTQTLVGIERLAPFHWRGERGFADFKPAFEGLLGATPEDGDGAAEPGEAPSEEEFQLFRDFVFSLVNPANPNQNRERLVDPAIHHRGTGFTGVPSGLKHDPTIPGDARAGQVQFQMSEHVNVGRHACSDCHAFPNGTINEINVEGDGSPEARRESEKPAPYHELWRKQQSMVQVQKNGVNRYVPFLGSGLSHLGSLQDVFRFVSDITVDVAGTDDDQKANNVADLLTQWDQGLGLAVHFAYLLDASSTSATGTELATYLHGEVQKRNCDIAVFGTAKDSSGALVSRRWAFDPAADAYVCEDPAFANRTLASFESGASSDGEANVFLGLPPGMAERFAIDYDMDGLRNLDPGELGTEYDPIQPGFDNGTLPGFAPGGAPEIVWSTARVARLVFTTDEPTSAVIDYVEPKTPARQAVSPRLSRHHSVLLTGLRPSTALADALSMQSEPPGMQYDDESVVYAATVTLTDATGNPVTASPVSFATDDFIVPIEVELAPASATGGEKKNQRAHMVEELCMGTTTGVCDDVVLNAQGRWQVKVTATVALKRGAWVFDAASGTHRRVRAANRALVGRVLIERANGLVETADAAGLAVTPTDVAPPGSPQPITTVELANEVRVTTSTPSLYEAPQAPGPFLAGTTLSAANGEVSLDFEVDPISSPPNPSKDLAAGDRIVFNVETVIEVKTSAATPIDRSLLPATILYAVRWRGALNQWSFPDTKEANASVRSAPLP